MQQFSQDSKHFFQDPNSHLDLSSNSIDFSYPPWDESKDLNVASMCHASNQGAISPLASQFECKVDSFIDCGIHRERYLRSHYLLLKAGIFATMTTFLIFSVSLLFISNVDDDLALHRNTTCLYPSTGVATTISCFDSF